MYVHCARIKTKKKKYSLQTHLNLKATSFHLFVQITCHYYILRISCNNTHIHEIMYKKNRSDRIQQHQN